jgi:alkylation response protein AidB-like acyl-CoA dehydrogenase
MPKRLGGQELPRIGMAACYEEMNRSIFGPVVFNSAAPDDGNMMILDRILPEAMKPRWLQPIVDGDVQSAFAMTEPDGCGSDPNLTYTKAERIGNDRWCITGRKWFITGAGNASRVRMHACTQARRCCMRVLLPVARCRAIPSKGAREGDRACIVFECARTLRGAPTCERALCRSRALSRRALGRPETSEEVLDSKAA